MSISRPFAPRGSVATESGRNRSSHQGRTGLLFLLPRQEISDGYNEVMSHLDVINTTQDDGLNENVIGESVVKQLRIQPPGQAAVGHGFFGAEQAMLTGGVLPDLDHTSVLPWVPDIVGSNWLAPQAMFVVGLAYAGFIKEYCGRPYSMPLAEYHTLRNSAARFMAAFMDRVATPSDPAYYGKIERLLNEAHVESKSWCLLDLCRASMVRRVLTNGAIFDDSRERNIARCAATRELFEAYFCENKDWTRNRFERSAAGHIVSLGRAAECGVLRLLLSDKWLQDPQVEPIAHAGFCPPAGNHSLSLLPDWVARNLGPKPRLWRIRGKLKGVGRNWTLVALAHPSARGAAWSNSVDAAGRYLTEHLRAGQPLN